MKLVATRDFTNSEKLKLDINPKTPNFQHVGTVPKGHRFEIAPEAKTLKGVTRDADKELIAQLVSAAKACMVDDGTPEAADVIKAIDTEVALEAKARNVKPAAKAVAE